MLDIASVMIVIYWRLTRKDVRYRLCNDSFILEIDQKRWLDIESVMIVLYWKFPEKMVRYSVCNDSFILEIDQKRC